MLYGMPVEIEVIGQEKEMSSILYVSNYMPKNILYLLTQIEFYLECLDLYRRGCDDYDVEGWIYISCTTFYPELKGLEDVTPQWPGDDDDDIF